MHDTRIHFLGCCIQDYSRFTRVQSHNEDLNLASMRDCDLDEAPVSYLG